MPDSKDGRDKQSHDEANRQRMRAMLEELERSDETEPEVPDETLEDLDEELATVEFPATARDLVESVGDYRVEATHGTYEVAQLIPRSETEAFDSPAAVRMRVQRPTVASAMKRIVEAAESHQGMAIEGSQREAYERTFRALKAIDAVDDDEGIEAIADWIIEQIAENESLPDSRGVRKEAADYCRSNGYVVRDDEWLGA